MKNESSAPEGTKSVPLNLFQAIFIIHGMYNGEFGKAFCVSHFFQTSRYFD